MNFSFATLRKRYVLLKYGKALAHTHHERSGQITGQVPSRQCAQYKGTLETQVEGVGKDSAEGTLSAVSQVHFKEHN